jgi:hypothetical protein
MATKKNARSLMRKELGKETADAMLNKLDKMAKKGLPASAIEKVLAEDLATYIEARIALSVSKGIKVAVSRGIKVAVSASRGIQNPGTPHR